MLTRKYYNKIAEIIKSCDVVVVDGWDFISKDQLVAKLIEFFENDNPRFNRHRFRKAVNPEEVFAYPVNLPQ